MDEIGRVPPQNIEAEQSVLGAILIDCEAFKTAYKIISSVDFYRPAHGKIFQSMLSLKTVNEPIDLITISAELRKRNDLDAVGGEPYLSALASQIPTAANIKYHAKIVKEASVKRQVIKSCFALTDRIYQDDDINLGLSKHRAELLSIAGAADAALVSMADIAVTVQNYVEHRSLHRDGIHGIPSGFIDLDNITDGFQKGDFIILGGRPGMGKSAYAMNIIENCGVSAGVVSLEMSGMQLGIRTLASLSGININSLRKGFIHHNEWSSITTATAQMANMPVFFSFSARRAQDIEKRIIELVEDKGAQIIVVDYLQLIRSEGSKQREREIADISVMLKGLAVDFQVPIIALAQLNREVERRENKRPILADLRESGSLEQDADIVIFLYRDEYYNKDSTYKGIAEVIIAKGRNVGMDVVKLGFIPDKMQFQNLYKEGY